MSHQELMAGTLAIMELEQPQAKSQAVVRSMTDGLKQEKSLPGHFIMAILEGRG
jgi:hypothetical protein